MREEMQPEDDEMSAQSADVIPAGDRHHPHAHMREMLLGAQHMLACLVMVPQIRTAVRIPRDSPCLTPP